MNGDNSKIISGALTLLVGVLIGFVLANVWLQDRSTKPDEPDPYIEMAFLDVEIEEFPEEIPPPTTFGGEQVAPALTPEDLDNPSELAPETGVQLKNNGPKAEETPKTVTTNRPSTVKSEKVEKPTKPTGPKVDNEQLKTDEQASLTANKAAFNAFNKPTSKGNANNREGDSGLSGSKTGKEGSAGPSDSKSSKVGVGQSKLPGGGWGWPSVPTNIKSSDVGTVTIELRLRPDGTVEKATAISNKGLSDATVNKCLAIAGKLRFTHPANAEIGTTATLTYTFE